MMASAYSAVGRLPKPGARSKGLRLRTPVDDRLRREAALYAFRFACTDCQHLDEVLTRCAEGYPIDEHVRGDLDRPDILFCKLFEGGR